MKYFILIITALLLIGCGNLKETKARNYYNSNKDKLAELCALNYPSNPIYIKGKEVVKYDTILKPIEIEFDCDTIQGKVKVKEVVKYVNTHTSTTDTIKTPDLAKESVLRDLNNELKASNTLLLKDNEKALKEARSANRTKYVLIVLLVISLIVIIKK